MGLIGKTVFRSAVLIGSLMHLACVRNADLVNNGGTSETTSATIAGAIWHDDGNRATAVTVRLTPSGYNPYAGSDTGNIVETVTDNNGNYLFKVASSGFFNVSAESEGTYCFEDSVYGTVEKRTEVDNDTLKAPGSVSGVARLQPGDDNREIVILVPGTMSYTMPVDTSGAFSIPVLAEGTYVLRLLTTNDDYGFTDTSVTVKSGKTTSIPGVVMVPYTGVPAVGAVHAQIDPVTMKVTISWPVCDTSKVAGLYLFRNGGITDTPLTLIKSTDTLFTDDVVSLDPDSLAFGDTLRYSVVAVGKDRSRGSASAAPDVRIKSFLTPIDTIPLSGFGCDFSDFLVDRNHQIFIRYYCGIMKIDSTGRVSAAFSDTGAEERIRAWTIDGDGNVYSFRADNRLVKFTPDLKPDTGRIVQGVPPDANPSMLTDNNGVTRLFLTSGTRATVVKTLDAALSELRSDTVPDYCNGPQMHNGIVFWTDFTLNSDNGTLVHPDLIREYDLVNGGLVKERYVGDIKNSYFPQLTNGFSSNQSTLAGARYIRDKGTFLFFDFPAGNRNFLLLAIDGSKNLVGRCGLSFAACAYDGVDRFYTVNRTHRSINVYKIN